MDLLWLLPLAIILVGLYFLLKAFMRVNAAMLEMKQTLAELGDMAPRLHRLAGDVSQLAQSMEEKRPQ